jgi:dTMP kinase
MARSGVFIAVEGVEGSGKSTQAERLAQRLRHGGNSIVTTKEPGGTALGDRVRQVLLDPDMDGMDSLTELLLYAASRRQNVVEIIKPALERGAVVLCDRFTDATLAYQGFGRLLELDRLRELNAWATDSTYPDLTLLFDIAEDAGLTRARARNAAEDLQKESRLEGEDLRFHRRVREGYLALSVAEPHRFAVIDASGTIDEVEAKVLEVLRARFPKLNL